ncbi:uncharacterized protein LOC108625240 isoform X2 [Ceratina calcarata]|uniref:Uncharacterized protein LOC108625240 isoform X2 n=1 Tax=Ceratina calcarata TaxID=156304 RepID=A0AAJ7IZ88_9HYME|nr:uncharacterized protein LOC108625240 isoform X2 [Ceratina calcarata]
MSPGINDGPRNTGTLPKSNRRNDRNREMSAAYLSQVANHCAYHGCAEHSNNLHQFNWNPVGEQERLRVTKNSNTRSTSSVPSTSYQLIPEPDSFGSRRHRNYSVDKYSHGHKMVPPTDSETQSPPRLQGTKPSNVDKMPDRSQVESRLSQIRDYIRVTSTMMDSLNQSSDPRAQAQNEKLSRMVEDLYDSESKLTKLLEQYKNCGIFCENGENNREDGEENGDVNREIELRRKMEESQRKLAQLQEHQASLQENQSTVALPLPANVEQLESETAALRGKLAQLQTKKKTMDHLVAELQAVEMSDRGSCSSEGSRSYARDKAAELEAMKAQLAHLKLLMEEATKVRECLDSNSDPEPEVDMNGESTVDIDGNVEENGANVLFDRQSDNDETGHEKIRNIGERPSVEEIQAVTRELREQSELLQSTRAELQRLKQPQSAMQSNSTAIYPTLTPPPSLTASISSEKKQSNNSNFEVQSTQGKKRQSEASPSVGRDMGGPTELNSHRSSSSHISHTSTPANIWPPLTTIGGSNDQSVDGISENLMDIGPQTTAIENGLNANWWAHPPPPLNQLQHGSTEYYRQLLLGSQAQQLQMMGTTIQQCCQLLWSQQRELQAMRTAITQLQTQLRQTQLQQRNSSENNDEYSNISRNIHHLGETLDSTLPPSSSLPNLVSLPNSAPAPSHTTATGSVNSQHQHQQLNNQVPPGNRANNYWDNFRSYSRQNLLSGNSKATETASGPAVNSASGNTISSVHTTNLKDKRNRDQAADNTPLPSLSGVEAQYSSNLQLQSNLQPQERENTVVRNNNLTNEVSQQQLDNFWEEAHSSFGFPPAVNDDNPLQNLSSEMREVLSSLISANKQGPYYLVIILRKIKTIIEDHRLRPRLLRSLRALQCDAQSLSNPLNETTDHTASESCQSSDEDSEVDGVVWSRWGRRAGNQSMGELVASSETATASSPTAHIPLIDRSNTIGASGFADTACALPELSPIKPGNNEDLAEADQSRPESTGNQQLPDNEEKDEEDLGEAAGQTESAQARFEMEFENLTVEDEQRSAGNHFLMSDGTFF